MSQKILITGAAGFIGFHLANSLCRQGFSVTGIDNLNDYYHVKLKQDRLKILEAFDQFTYHSIDICNKELLDPLFHTGKFDFVINLAAQAGVRFSIEHPYRFIDSNLIGFLNVLEACRQNPPKHLIIASSSSVYGNSNQTPFTTIQKTDEPVSLYAATKKANELMAHSYASLYKIPITALRFFTVYGPWGRPDMAYFSFTKKIMEEKTIKVFNHGKMERDFTYIDDVVMSIGKLLDLQPQGNAPFQVYNIGNHQPVELNTFIEILEKLIGKKAIRENLPLQPGDVMTTCADTHDLRQVTGFHPNTPLDEGLDKFVTWYKNYYHLN